MGRAKLNIVRVVARLSSILLVSQAAAEPAPMAQVSTAQVSTTQVPAVQTALDVIPHIREFCAVRHVEDEARRLACEVKETESARSLFDRIESLEKNSPGYRVTQQCIERFRLKSKESTRSKLEQIAVNWTRALQCADSHFSKLSDSEEPTVERP